MGKQCNAENKKISKRYWGQGLLTQELLGHIFSFENLVTELTPKVVSLA